MPVLAGDSRARWDRRVLRDRRVTQLWDQEQVVGTWFQANGGSFWDAYYLYGPGARWRDRPTAPVASGSPIVGATGELGREVRRLLGR
jgi:hypothetical protein